MRARTLTLTVAVIALALSLAACADDGGDASEASGGDDGRIHVEMGDMYFEPDSITIPAGQAVEVELENVGAAEHDLVLEDGFDSGMVAPGESTVIELGPLDESTTGWCSVPGHQSAGMELEINVE